MNRTQDSTVTKSQQIKLNRIKGDHNQITINNYYGSTSLETEVLREKIKSLEDQVRFLQSLVLQSVNPVPIIVNNHNNNTATSGKASNKANGIKSSKLKMGNSKNMIEANPENTIEYR